MNNEQSKPNFTPQTQFYLTSLNIRFNDLRQQIDVTFDALVAENQQLKQQVAQLEQQLQQFRQPVQNQEASQPTTQLNRNIS